jgi:curved DNA-binding protein
VVSYKDYYKILEVERTASQSDIQKSYRKLARKYHPDVNQDPAAADTFKAINEAYEVLKDPEKRQRYDALGENWQNGENFQVPPEWAELFGAFGGGRGGATFGRTATTGGNGFSDFFETVFGGAGGSNMFSGHSAVMRGSDVRGEIQISLEEAFAGAKKQVSFDIVDSLGGRTRKSLSVQIPAGTRDGSAIRLSGQGQSGANGGPAGDLLLGVSVSEHPSFSLEGSTLHTSVSITPWEAALGAKVPVRTLDGTLKLTVPAGTSSGKKFRLKGKGFPTKSGRGDLIVEARMVIPEKLSGREKELFETLSKESAFNPRS